MRSDSTDWLIRGMGLALGALIVYGLVQVGIAAGNVLLLLFASVLLASALEQMIGWLRTRLPLSRVGTILVVYLAFFVVMIGMAFIVLPAAVNQGQRIVPHCRRSSSRFDSGREGYRTSLPDAANASSK